MITFMFLMKQPEKQELLKGLKEQVDPLFSYAFYKPLDTTP